MDLGKRKSLGKEKRAEWIGARTKSGGGGAGRLAGRR